MKKAKDPRKKTDREVSEPAMTDPNKSPSLQEFREKNIHNDNDLEKHTGQILVMKVYSEDLWCFSMCSINMVGSEDIYLHKYHVLHSDIPHAPFILHRRPTPNLRLS